MYGGNSGQERGAAIVAPGALSNRVSEPLARISDVAREIEIARKIGTGLHNLIDLLEHRLLPVRLAQPPSTEAASVQQPSANTDLARSLQLVNVTNDAASLRLQTIIDTIDL